MRREVVVMVAVVVVVVCVCEGGGVSNYLRAHTT